MPYLRIRILMGDEVTHRTKKAMLLAVKQPKPSRRCVVRGRPAGAGGVGRRDARPGMELSLERIGAVAEAAT